MSINVISANEINDNDINSISVDSNAIDLDSSENINTLFADSNQDDESLSHSDELNTEVSQKNSNDEENMVETSVMEKGNENNSLKAKNLINTNITIQSNSILRGNTLYVFLKDANGNALANKNLSLSFNNAVYNKTTDTNGRVSLKISSAKAGNYNLIVNFRGDSQYKASEESFNINVYQYDTHITVNSKTILRGNSLNIYLRNSTNDLIPGQNITITFRGKKYTKTTNANGKVSLLISSAPRGNYSIQINFDGSTEYAPSNRSFTLNVYQYETHITVNSKTILRGNRLYVYLRNSTNNLIPGENITITFRGKEYIRTTNDNSGVSLLISSAPRGNYSIQINFDGSTEYAPSNRSFTLNVYQYETHITVNSKTITRGNSLNIYLRNSTNDLIPGENITIIFRNKKYVKTTNSNGKVSLLINSTPKGKYPIKINFNGTTSYAESNRSFTLIVLAKGGSGIPITQKTIVIDTDWIYSSEKDIKFMNDIKAILKAKGYNVIISERDPDAHCHDIRGKYSNACILCIFGGCDSGMFVDMSSSWYQNLLKKYNNRVVLGIVQSKYNLANCTYMPRSGDDNYSTSSFEGLAYPGKYLNDHGMDYIYGSTASQMANNFLNYAVDGYSIGKDNTSPIY